MTNDDITTGITTDPIAALGEVHEMGTNVLEEAIADLATFEGETDQVRAQKAARVADLKAHFEQDRIERIRREQAQRAAEWHASANEAYGPKQVAADEAIRRLYELPKELVDAFWTAVELERERAAAAGQLIDAATSLGQFHNVGQPQVTRDSRLAAIHKGNPLNDVASLVVRRTDRNDPRRRLIRLTPDHGAV